MDHQLVNKFHSSLLRILKNVFKSSSFSKFITLSQTFNALSASKTDLTFLKNLSFNKGIASSLLDGWPIGFSIVTFSEIELSLYTISIELDICLFENS